MSQLRASLALPIRAESQSSVSPEQLLRETHRPQKRGCVKGMASFSRVLVPLVGWGGKGEPQIQLVLRTQEHQE